MLSFKRMILDALIENLTCLLCREDAPLFFDLYLDLLDHFMHARCTLCAR